METNELIDDLLQRGLQGDYRALCEAGKRFYLGAGVDKDIDKAVECWKIAAENNNPEAIGCLGTCYLNGEGVEKDTREGLKLYHKADSLGSVDAKTNLGLYYFTVKDYRAALNWFKKASKLNELYALCALGKMTDEGLGCKADPKQGFKYYLQAAQKGYVIAMKVVAERYSTGFGVQQDQVKSLYWTAQAAAKGDAKSKFAITRFRNQGLNRR